MLVDRKKMRIARENRAREKQKQREAKHARHSFLACEKPNMVVTKVGYDLYNTAQFGVIKYHKCHVCGKEVGT